MKGIIIGKKKGKTAKILNVIVLKVWPQCITLIFIRFFNNCYLKSDFYGELTLFEKNALFWHGHLMLIDTWNFDCSEFFYNSGQNKLFPFIITMRYCTTIPLAVCFFSKYLRISMLWHVYKGCTLTLLSIWVNVL